MNPLTYEQLEWLCWELLILTIVFGMAMLHFWRCYGVWKDYAFFFARMYNNVAQSDPHAGAVADALADRFFTNETMDILKEASRNDYD